CRLFSVGWRERKSMKQALIVVDVQESFRQRPYFRDEELPRFLRNVQSLVNRCTARGIAVVQVLHQEPGDDPGNPFTAASGFVRTMPELSLEADEVCFKRVLWAMCARDRPGAALEAWLREGRIPELLITGIRTEECRVVVSQHASDLGFQV